MPCRWSAFSPLSLLESLGRAKQRYAAAGQNAFLDCSAGRMHRVFDAILALPHFHLGRAADADYRDAAGELGEPLLQLLAIVVGGGLLDLRLELIDAGLDVGLRAGAVDDRGVLLIDHHLLGAAEHVEGDLIELDAEIIGNRGAAGKDRNVLEHRFAPIAETGRLDGRDLQAAAQPVDD